MLKNVLTIAGASLAIMMSVSLPASAADDEVQVPESSNVLPLIVLGMGLAGKKMYDLNQERK
jgi:hypothetical protein